MKLERKMGIVIGCLISSGDSTHSLAEALTIEYVGCGDLDGFGTPDHEVN